MGTGPTNYQLQLLIAELEQKASESNLWQRVVQELKKPTRQRREVNLYKISEHALEGETVLVPGKVLSLGEVSKKVDVAAMSFSAEAKRKITASKGKAYTIKELFEQNPQGKKIRILG
ncbi:50S ribosomal protein L18e [Candidatus Woesearchaeota archaeon]|nr:50S ribosomal protein L18e [Candidatus Woesearchaeota archaeon]